MHYDVVTDSYVNRHVCLQSVTPSDVGCKKIKLRFKVTTVLRILLSLRINKSI